MAQSEAPKANPFGSSTTPAATQSSNPFGSMSQSVPSSTENAVTGQNDAIVYTQVEKLDDEEIKAFQADEFTLETIPIHPPPKEACR